MSRTFSKFSKKIKNQKNSKKYLTNYFVRDIIALVNSNGAADLQSAALSLF